jgi:Spy/CpxP family protein refolding chaperone
MKRQAVTLALLLISLIVTTGWAQTRAGIGASVQQDVAQYRNALALQVPQQEDERRRLRESIINLQQLLGEVQQLQFQQRGGGRTGGPATPTTGGVFIRRETLAGGAWWTNPGLVERLGLTDEQKARIERAFENHRQSLVSTTELLQKEEALLAKLLEAEPLERNAVLSQTDRVIQARGELERTNAAMTLEMREVLTRAQWLQLPQSAMGNVTILPAGAGPTTPGLRGGGGGRRGGAAPGQQ